MTDRAANSRRPPVRWNLTVAIAACLAAVTYSAFLLDRWTGTPRDPGREFISQLELPGQPWNWLFRLSDIVSGISIGVTAIAFSVVLGYRDGIRPNARVGIWLLFLTGLASTADGATTMHCADALSATCGVDATTPSAMLAQLVDAHADSGVVGLVGAAAAAILLGSVFVEHNPVLGRVSIILGTGIAVTGLLDVVLLAHGVDIGVVERLRILLTSAWLFTVAAVAALRLVRDWQLSPRTQALNANPI
ncbi:MAG: hypothetical protein JWM76_2757 [Pseudonocardiales bacterium]|nr:hypothetical protein [Pseudonocardiales bacterium]